MTRKPGQIQAQIDGVERILGLEPRARILDLACGSGRRTLELARRGYRVLGLDLFEDPPTEARRLAREERLNAHFIHGDARQISYREEFDAVVVFQPSFGRLAGEREAEATLRAARRGLKPEGRLLMDLINKEWLMRHFDSHRDFFDFETGRLNGSQRVYCLTEAKRLLEESGLAYLKSWGGFGGEAYSMDSPRLIVLAGKTHEKRRARRAEGPPTAIRIKGRRKGRP
ncbi:MAG: class I SAM-dependent methyltransferase [Elusimicrobia bacterium]|nr:class I SAM-dependent methyltransferase [Elusimicrobiota bacterium]